ncbi:MAG: DNA-binding response regulator [Bacteroidetes bacterium HGW-Bacteroidetes-1]|jgi:two-component system response regulator NreC|nr:MAG: DNA-binding response regulator [Bacteroidetes bacterium HGW-Bacteroidetes-1]
MIKVIITDDHQMVIDGLKAIINHIEGYKVIATALNGRELLKSLEVVEPDIILLDIDMPVMNGIEALSEIRKSFHQLKVIVLSMHEEKSLVKKLTDLGAKGFLFKNSDKEELMIAMNRVANGGYYFSSSLTMNLINVEIHDNGNPAPKTFILTERETEILKLIASGLSNKEIGDKLFISHRTVDTHRTNLMKKLEVNNIAGLIRYAIKNGYIQ